MEPNMLVTTCSRGHFLPRLVLALSLVVALGSGAAASSEVGGERIKRQVFANRVPAFDNRRPESPAQVAANIRPARPGLASPISASLTGPNLQASGPDVDAAVSSSAASQASGTSNSNNNNVAVASDDFGDQPPVQPNNQRRPRPRRPSRRRPNKQNNNNNEPNRYRPATDEEEDDEDCYDDDDGDDVDGHGDEYDYGQMFHGMTRNPMRQFTRMFNGAMNRMQSAYDDDYSGDYGRGGSGTRASSSAISSGDGYSRAVSQVTNNGRSQGLISETSNGRTQTRRIGGDDDDDSY